MFYITEDYLVGVEEVDLGRRKIIETANEILKKLNDELEIEEAKALIKATMNMLKKYADETFTIEEKYMESIIDPESACQKKEHESFRKFVNEYNIKEITEGTEKTELEKIENFLVKWILHHIMGSDMMIGKIDPFQFTSKYKLGIELIDKEHQRLFEIVHETYILIKSEDMWDKFDEIVKIMDELKDYTVMHFGDEEAYMRKIRYEKLDEQIVMHTAFVDKIKEINLEEVDTNQQAYLLKLIDFLLVWLNNHILKEDKMIPSFSK